MYRWIITIAVVLLSLVIWKQVNPSKSAVEITLRNGSRFRVYELTFGTNVVLGKTTIWQKFLGHMPSKLQPASFRPPSVITLQTPSTVLVYDITRPDGQPSNPLNFSWVDENGFESSGNGSTAWSGLYGTNMVQARIFSSAPRRSKVIKLKILDSMRGPEAALQGEMVFQSQIQSQVPPWVAISLPQTQQVNAVTVRLLDAAYGMEYGEKRLLSSSNTNEQWTFLKLVFSSGDKPETNWGVTSVASTDASGNFLYANAWGGRWTGGEYLFWFRESLWPVEPIRYRLQIGIQSNYGSNETLTVSDVPIPPQGGFSKIGISTNLLGQRIDVDGFVDKGVVPPWRIDNRWGSSASLHMTLPLLASGTQVRVLSVMDDLGNECLFHGSTSSDSEYAYGVKFWDGAKTATIKLAIRKSVSVEFTALPHQARPDSK